MRVDSNTNGHRQWFYFSMKSQRKCKVKLHIYRFKKFYSLFQRGMKPYVRSRKSGLDWAPGGDNICYHYEKQTNEFFTSKQKKSSVLSFTYTFNHENDEVFIAAGIPYTYTFLQRQLNGWRQSFEKRQNLDIQISTLCKSMCGLDLQLITIQHKMAKRIHESNPKKFIIINARTHSGQSSGSWVLDGILEEISRSEQIQSWILADNICLKIVPMLNPDGVFIGNYRTGIIGDDFNRKFNSAKKEFYPEITALKKLVVNCKKSGKVQLFLDLHGHSILKNSFIYGPSESQFSNYKLKSLPYKLFHYSKYFRLASCKFKSERENIETARVYFQLKEDILTFTCQNSLGLYYNQKQTLQMLAGDWKDFGRSIIQGMREIFGNTHIQIPKNDQRCKLFLKPSTTKSPTKSSIINEAEKRITEDSGSRAKFQNVTSNKLQKIYFKMHHVRTNKAEQQFQKFDKVSKNNVSISQHLSRQNEIVRIGQPLKIQKISHIERQSDQNVGKNQFNIRRRSLIMKVSAKNIADPIVSKIKRDNKNIKTSCILSEEEAGEYIFGRSSTFDNHSDYLRMEIDKANNQQFEYEMKTINQNFSQEYSSMNDSDSDGEDLSDQAKNYIFDYIKSSQMQHGLENKNEYSPQERIREESLGKGEQPKISKFRQIRFKSIDEVFKKQTNKNNLKKIKLDLHKFKDNTGQSLKNKYIDIVMNSEFDDPNMVAISQQKKLNQRVGQYRRTQKDPFIFIHHTERIQDKLPDKEIPY